MVKSSCNGIFGAYSKAESSASGARGYNNTVLADTPILGSKKRAFQDMKTDSSEDAAGPSTPFRKRQHVNGNGNSKYNGFGNSGHRKPKPPSYALGLNGRQKPPEPSPSEQRRFLPIWPAKDALLREIRENDTVVILGETGSGKTTQIPQFIYEAGLCQDPKLIAITQPRKVAATSLAARVSVEQERNIGSLVGYSVRFDEKSSDETRIKYMTDGMLFRELLTDSLLNRYAVIVVDEAHERTLRTDLLLTALKGIAVKRNYRRSSADFLSQEQLKDPSKKEGEREVKEMEDLNNMTPLKIIIMSATLDAQRFSQFFNGAKILYVKGRQHPVTVLHTQDSQEDYVDSALQTFYQIHTEKPPGDVLIFLPGQEDIESLTSSIKSLSEQIPPDQMQVIVCQMFAALPAPIQQRAFFKTPPNTRKVILATNIAETSITIPGVRYVIDTGLCKEKAYFSNGRGGGIEALLTRPISKSSALQRTGRAGREGEGWCFRLYTEALYNSDFQEAATPEIQRCNLTLAVLQMKYVGQNPQTADFMDAPAPETLLLSLQTLYQHGSLDATGEITQLGRQMAHFPLDPLQSRALIESTKHDYMSSVISILSLLSSTGKIFMDTHHGDREAADEVKLKFRHRSGDHMTLLNALRAYEDVLGHSTNQSTYRNVHMDSEGTSKVVDKKYAREWCRVNFLSERSLKEALDIRKQLEECCGREKFQWKQSGTTKEDSEKEAEAVLKSLLTGLWQNTALINPDGTYRQSVGLQPIRIHPSSSLFGKKCPAIMYDEVIFTSNTYAMGVSAIQQAWLAEVPAFAQHRQALASTQSLP
ncbi:putative ATP-dependent RNA helicase dhr2 [Tulasnella sp. 330]|nr:putative ATP-dependent RNA helicase dhr2 [Tulasnella sp. 330]KAG8885657.1 putative ATP-dependent RNA helicase dhr2 [Tulasnella sp. 331]